MLIRERHLQILPELLRRHPVVAILGARQIGKTTLARQLIDRLVGKETLEIVGEVECGGEMPVMTLE